MSVEFRLGAGDHKVVEDYLLRSPDGIGAITLDAKKAHHQREAAAVAREAGIKVLFDPATERLASPGYGLDRFPCYAGQPYDLEHLIRNPSARHELVQRVVEAHDEAVTHITPPHFFAEDLRMARLNVELVELTRLCSHRPLRPVAVLGTRFAMKHRGEIAHEYAAARITELDLRLSPLGGGDESLKKVREAFEVAREFTSAGIAVTLGQSGNLGQIAVALGRAAAYSVGIGMLEHVDHRAVVNRQSKPPRPLRPGEQRRSPVAGVYLPGVAETVTRKAGQEMLANTDIRTRVGCRIDGCGDSIEGPMNDVRTHYLHARAGEMTAMLARPASWRATLEIERLKRALELRVLVNQHYLPAEVTPLKTRTLRSLIDDIDQERAAS